MSDFNLKGRELKGIVSKPQFDTDTYFPGKCVYIKTKEEYVYNGARHINSEGMIINSTPLSLEVQYIYKGCVEQITIPIEFIVKDKLSIEPLLRVGSL